MNLLDKLKTLVEGKVNSAVSDLLGEGDTLRNDVTRRVSTQDTEKLLKQADKRLEKLRDDLAATVAREKRAAQSWQAAGAQASQLNDEVDALLRADKSDEARAKLQLAKKVEQQAATLERELQRFEKVSVQLREEIAALEDQLSKIRARLNQTEEREASATVVEETQQARQAQKQHAAKAEQELKDKEEQVAQREDKAAAKAELDSTRMADVIKKLKEQKDK